MNESKRNVLDLIYNVGSRDKNGFWRYNFIHGAIECGMNLLAYGICYNENNDTFYILTSLSGDTFEVSLSIAEMYINNDYFNEL